MRILLVDDEPRLRQAIARSLSVRGYQVQEAATARSEERSWSIVLPFLLEILVFVSSDQPRNLSDWSLIAFEDLSAYRLWL